MNRWIAAALRELDVPFLPWDNVYRRQQAKLLRQAALDGDWTLFHRVLDEVKGTMSKRLTAARPTRDNRHSALTRGRTA